MSAKHPTSAEVIAAVARSNNMLMNWILDNPGRVSDIEAMIWDMDLRFLAQDVKSLVSGGGR